MACDLTTGYNEPCKDAVGGLKAVYFINYGDKGASTVTGDEITDFAEAAVNAYKFDLKGTSNLVQNVQSSRDNGTTAYEQVLTLRLKKMSTANNSLLKLMAQGRPHIVIEDNNGNSYMIGDVHGAEVTGGTVETGSGLSEFNGYNLTLSANEADPAITLRGGVASDPFAGLAVSVVTIVEAA